MRPLVDICFEVWLEIYRLIVRGGDTRLLDAEYTHYWSMLDREQRAELLARQLATRS